MSSLKLFFQLPYKCLGWRPELELAKRLEIVCNRLGHECFVSSSVRDAREFRADYIFALHFNSAKVTPHLSVGLIWNPLSFMRRVGMAAFVNTLTHDAHFYGAESLRSHFSALSAQGHRTRDLGDFYPSAERTKFIPIQAFGLPTYVGALWQEDRHRELLSALNERKSIHGYGPSHSWSRFKEIYRGGFAIDGRSYQAIYRRSGIGLCLHSQEHLVEGIPAMRIFEITAAGCVAICDDHPFIREHFGETVHYLRRDGSPREVADQVTEIAEKIRSSPVQSREMAEAAHRIFNEKLCLDHLLSQALDKMAEFRETRFGTAHFSNRKPTVQIVTRTAGARSNSLRRALQSVADQSYGHVKVTLLYHGPTPKDFLLAELPLLQAEFPGLPLDFISLSPEEPLSQTIPAACRHGDADFIGFLDDDDWYYPEHLQTLLTALKSEPKAVFAISGAAVDWEWSLNSSTLVPVNSYSGDSSELLSFELFDSEKFKKGEMNLCLAMLLFRRSLLPVIWDDWPPLRIGEDRALLALLSRNQPDCGVFTSHVSCAWTYRHLQNDNQIDLIHAEASSSRTDFTYKGLNLPYLQSTKIGRDRYHSDALARKCLTARRKVNGYRWIPRSIRPLTYQRKLNVLLSSILEELIDIGVLGSFNTGNSDQFKHLIREANPFASPARQQNLNKILLRMLSIAGVEGEMRIQQHALNLMVVQEVERLGRIFG